MQIYKTDWTQVSWGWRPCFPKSSKHWNYLISRMDSTGGACLLKRMRRYYSMGLWCSSLGYTEIYSLFWCPSSWKSPISGQQAVFITMFLLMVAFIMWTTSESVNIMLSTEQDASSTGHSWQHFFMLGIYSFRFHSHIEIKTWVILQEFWKNAFHNWCSAVLCHWLLNASLFGYQLTCTSVQCGFYNLSC